MSSSKTVDPEAARDALQQGIDNKAPLKDIMKLYTAYVFECHDRNKVHAAKALNVNRRTLQRWNLPASV